MATADEPAAPAAPSDDGFNDISPAAPEAPADKKPEAPEPDDKPAEGDQQPEDPSKTGTDDDEAKKRHDAEMAKKRIEERKQRQPENGAADGGPDSPDDAPADGTPDDDAADDEPSTPDEFMGKLEADIAKELSEIEDENDRRIQTIEARQYLSEAKTATNQLLIEHSRVQADIPIFNPESPEFNKQAYEHFVNEFQVGHTVTDNNGVIWPRQSLYQFMKEASELLSGVSQKSALKGQQAEAKMRGRAEVPSGAGKRGSSEDDDPFLKGFLGS